MKLYTSLLFGFAASCGFLVAEESDLNRDEIAALRHLTETTEKKLALQKELSQLMLDFRRQKERFIQGDESKPNALKMVKMARQILEIITQEHLHYLFSSEYMDELVMFSSIAGKNSPARP